jgi:3-oxoacyl-[acyl-carrier-protein] synthase III
MPASYISYYDYYQPCHHIALPEVLARVNDTVKNKNYLLKYGNLDKIAVELRYNQFEMYDAMLEKYFATHRADEIQYLIFTGKDYFTNSGMSVPYYIIGKYGLKNAGLIALNQGCSGTPQAIQLADHIIKSAPDLKVLIISLSKLKNIEARYSWPTVYGDGAGILVIESTGFLKVCDCVSWSDGSVSLARCTNSGKTAEIDLIQRENLLMLNVKKIILNLLERNQLGSNDIKKYIPQSIHHLLYRLYAKSINVKIDKFFLENLPDGGHLGDVDSIRNLKDAVLKYNERAGELYLLFTLGELGDNYSYHAILFESC